MSFRRFLPAATVLAAASLTFSAVAQEARPEPRPGGPQAQDQRPMAGPGPGRADMRCERLARVDRKLSQDQIRDIVAGQLAQTGVDTLKVGKVRSAGEVVSVDIVTTSGSLVSTREISTKTGLRADLAQQCQDRQGGPRPGLERGNDRGPGMARGPGGGGRGMIGGPGIARGPGPGEGAVLGLIGNDTPRRDLNLSTDQARKLAEAELVRLGNPRLKIGAVKEKDADTVTVDIVTQDNALVLRQEMDRHSGRVHQAS